MILFLKPYFEVKPWAGDELGKLYDCPNGTGEAWIISGYNNKSSVITNGRFKGQTLRHLWMKHQELFGEFGDKEFPILIKLISSKEKLSVQVHPDDLYALKKHNSLGKFECWYILPETKNKDIIVGVKSKNQRDLKDIMDSGYLNEFLLKKTIKPHDLVVIEPGTVHAICEDTFLLEVQESSDITYRLYDYDRLPKRELHVDDSLNVINFNNNNNKVYDFSHTEVFDNPFFKLEKVFVDTSKTITNDSFRMVYVVSGEGKVESRVIKKGDTFLITKDSTNITFSGNLELLVVTPKQKPRERLKMRKVALITGITNQDGYYLTKLLLEKDYEVHGLVQSKGQFLLSYTSEFLDNDNFFYEIGDLTDSSSIHRVLENVKPDEIYHLGSQSHVDVSFDMPEYTTEVNALGTLRLFDAVKNIDLRCKIFNLISPYIYSGEEYPQNEETKIDPKSPYAASKVFAYNIAKCYRENNKLFITNGICYNHESIKRNKSFVSAKIIEHVKAFKNGNKKVLELGNLDSRREWGHAVDYANAMWRSLQEDIPNDFVISTSESYTVREFVTKVFNKININILWTGEGLDEVGIDSATKEVLVKVNPKFLRPNDAKVLVGDSTKFKTITNFKFEYDIDKVIDSLMED